MYESKCLHFHVFLASSTKSPGRAQATCTIYEAIWLAEICFAKVEACAAWRILKFRLHYWEYSLTEICTTSLETLYVNLKNFREIMLKWLKKIVS